MCQLIYYVKDGYNQTQSVSYSANIGTVLIYHFTIEDIMFYCLNSEKIRHYVLAKLLYYSWALLAIGSGLSGHRVLAATLILIQFCFILLSVNIADTMCQLIYSVKDR